MVITVTIKEFIYMKQIELDLLKVRAGIFEETPKKDFYIKRTTGHTTPELRYSPDQPRDDHGRFTDAGGSDSSGGDSGLTDSSESGIIAHKEEIKNELKENGFKYSVSIPPCDIDVNSLAFDAAHINQRKHDVTEKQAKKYIKNASISYTKTVRGEQFENYIGDEGAAYVNMETKTIRTAFSHSEFNPGTIAIINTVNKYK